MFNSINVGQFQRDSLKSHNDYRSKHGVPALTLSADLNNFAQEWANNLAAENNMKHRPNNKYGENLYWSSGSQVTAEVPVKAWYDEIKYYNFSNGQFAMNTGHFTQVVWKKSLRLGVGIAKSRNGGVYVVANYDPPGNYAGQFAENVPRPGAGAGTTTTTGNGVPPIINRPPVVVPPINRPPVGVPSINRPPVSVGNINQFEQECLNAHNAYRYKHNVPALTLNRTICLYAQEWANTIAAQNAMRHRPAPKYGENIYWASGVAVTGSVPVKAWYDEMKNYDFAAGRYWSNVGHFTQVVWKKSSQFGVGMAKSANGSVFVVANYDPPGNYAGQFLDNVPRPIR